MKGKVRVLTQPFFVASLLLLLITSCADQPEEFQLELDLFGDPIEIVWEQTEKEYPNVEPKLWLFFQRFEKAAAERGLNFDLNEANITASIDYIENGSAGACTMTNNQTIHHIIIDANFWTEATDGMIELIIFHELGHCFLEREHNDEKFNNGVCKSIMRSKISYCLDNYTTNTRNYYLNELFEI